MEDGESGAPNEWGVIGKENGGKDRRAEKDKVEEEAKSKCVMAGSL